MAKEGEELNQDEQFAQEAVERLMSPDGEFKDPINRTTDDDVDDEPEDGKKAPKAKPKGTGSDANVNLGEFGEKILEKIGIDKETFKVEKGVDPADYLVEHVSKKAIEKLPPLTRFILEHENAGNFNEEEFIQQLAGQTKANLTGQALISEYMYAKFGGKYDEKENPDGLTEDDVKEDLGKRTKIELKRLEAEAKDFFKDDRSNLMKSYFEKKQKENDALFDQIVETQISNAQILVKDSSKIKEINGVPVSKEELAEFNEILPSLITPDKETGMAPFYQALYSLSNEEFYKVLFTLTKGDGYFKDKMLERVNEAKTGIKKKLNLSPRRTTQKGSGTGPKEIDPFLLSIPEQNQ